MGRKKIDRSDKVMQTFESTVPLKKRLSQLAKAQQLTLSALIRKILEEYLEERNYF